MSTCGTVFCGLGAASGLLGISSEGETGGKHGGENEREEEFRSFHGLGDFDRENEPRLHQLQSERCVVAIFR
jgi:hypothetical protein